MLQTIDLLQDNKSNKTKQTVKIVIRNAKMTDLNKMKEINERCLQENYNIEFWHEIWNTNKSCCFVAVFSGMIIGYVLSSANDIVSFAVDEEYRNKKVGKELMKNVLNNFKSDVRLNVRISNDAARMLYKNLGFTDDTTVKDYYRNPVEDSIEMVKKYDKTSVKYITNEKMKITINDNNVNNNKAKTSESISVSSSN